MNGRSPKYRAVCSFVLAVLLSLGVGSRASAFAQTQDTIRITNGEWPPFTSESGPHHGMASHIVAKAFARVGIEVKYGFYPWNRSYKLAEEGKWDASAVWWFREHRLKDFLYSDAIFPTTTVFFHLKGMAFNWNTYEDLKSYRIGDAFGFDHGEAYKAAKETGITRVETTTDEVGNLRKLLKGRIDLYPGELTVTYWQIRDTFPAEKATRFTHHPKVIKGEPLFLIFSNKVPENERMRDRFNEGLRALKESGTYDQILSDGLAGKYDAKPK